MFGIEFYPTPKKVIGKMLEPFLKPDPEAASYRGYNKTRLLSKMVILEPSAGKGDIVDYIHEFFEYSRSDRPKVYCCELDMNLRTILQKKRYRVIADDFLTYSGDYLFDLIVMNPPFSNGGEHVLKAWDILEEGHIVALLNLQTIENPYSEKRKHLKRLIEQFGSYENIGQVFKDAEHAADVEVALVRLHKKANRKKLDFEFENVTKERKIELDENTFSDAIATRDVIGNMIIQYEKLKEYYVDYLKVRDGLNFYSEGLISRYSVIHEIAKNAISSNNNITFNNFCDLIKQEIWKVVLTKTNVEKYMTHNVRRNFSEFCEHQGYMDFTKENVASLIHMIFENRVNIMENAIVEVFDMFTRHHKENRYLIEGWKTNDKWKVNRKIILPYAVKMSWEKPADRMRFGAEYQVNYHRSSEYTDIDKVMCYLTGTPMDSCYTIYCALEDAFRRIGTIYKGPASGTAVSQFFKMKFFMKGTLHLEFRDEKLWEEFNLRACAGKQWLPEDEMKEYQERKKREAKPKQQASQPGAELLMIEAPAEETFEECDAESCEGIHLDSTDSPNGQTALTLF